MTSQTPGPLVRTSKAATGIVGFDEITGGGLPDRRTTLLSGGPGSGKPLFAMQFLAHGIRTCVEPGIFVAFEEKSTRIVANFEGLGSDIVALPTRTTESRERELSRGRARMGELRGADAVSPEQK